MLIALCIVSPLLFLSLCVNVWLYVNGRSWKDAFYLSCDEQDVLDELLGLKNDALAVAERKIEDLEAELLIAEEELEESADDFDLLQSGVLDAMDDIAEAGSALECALGHLAGALDCGDDDDGCECEECGLRIAD